VDHVFRLVDGSDVPLVLLENVSFMLKLDRGSAMTWLTHEFEKRGFRWAYRTINSLAFLPQRRERVFFLASRGDLEPADVLFTNSASPPTKKTALDTHAHGFYWTEGTRGLGWAPDATPPLKNGSTVGIASPPAILMPDGTVIKPDIRDAERLQGFPENWTQPAEATDRASLRWSLVGNAVTVPVARWIGEQLISPQKYESVDTQKPLQQDTWPRAALYDGEKRLAAPVGDFPVWFPRPALHNFLRHKGDLLSARATKGFYTRALTGSLRFQPGFLDRIAAHLERMEKRTSIKAA
jgi:DNA (cytosine-5)-methyltransferase 1